MPTKIKSPLSPSHDKIIDASGWGDYTSIRLACATELAGTSFFIRNGTYNENDDIIIKSGQVLEGETREGVIIDMTSGTDKGVRINDAVAVQTAGSVGTTNDSTAVSGSGTTFTSLSALDYISIEGSVYQIQSITNDTALVLTTKWKGQTATGRAYFAGTFFVRNRLRTLTIKGGTSSGAFISLVKIYGCINLVIENCIIRDAVDGRSTMLDCRYCFESRVEGCSFIGKNYYGENFRDCNSFTFERNIVKAGYRGLQLTGCSYSKVIANVFSSIQGTVCAIGNASNYNIIANNHYLNCMAQAISLGGGSTQKNSVLDNYIWKCLGGIYLESHEYSGLIKGNYIYGCTQHGIWVKNGADHCTVMGNFCSDNDFANTKAYDGIYIEAGVTYISVIGNKCYNNDRYEINNAGTGTLIVDNHTYGTDREAEIIETGTNTKGSHYKFATDSYAFFGQTGDGYVQKTDVSSPVTCVMEKSYDNIGAGGAVTYNLPTAVAGLRIRFIVAVAQNMVVTASSGDKINLGTSSSSVAGTATSNAPFSMIELLAVDATNWVAISATGTWTLA
jgi:parallel beta-helix repeat protein